MYYLSVHNWNIKSKTLIYHNLIHSSTNIWPNFFSAKTCRFRSRCFITFIVYDPSIRDSPKSTKGAVVHSRYKFVLRLLVLIFHEKINELVPWKSTRLFYTSRFLTVLSRLWVRCVMGMPWKSMAWCVNGLSQHGGPCMDIYQQVLFVKISIVFKAFFGNKNKG